MRRTASIVEHHQRVILAYLSLESFTLVFVDPGTCRFPTMQQHIPLLYPIAVWLLPVEMPCFWD
ncbi:MAG: hypothetical protein CBD74_02440 [Saprospirales bacterium TMED214]|nr:MAG: hypothetical protein CBD74_02440 [Saprospirales bacterium TMED214]